MGKIAKFTKSPNWPNLKTLHYYLLIFLLSFPAFGQEEVNYEQLADTASDRLVQLAAMDTIIYRNRRADLDKFIDYSIRYMRLAREVDSFEWAAKKMINVSYSLTSRKNNPNRTLELIDTLLMDKDEIHNSFLLGGLYLKRGGANFRLDLEQSVVDYDSAIANYGPKDSIYMADAFLFSGQAYANMGKFVPAGENYKKAYEYFESLKDYEYMYYARQGITTMYSMNGFYDKAQIEREGNIAKIRELGLEHHLVTAYYNQALDFQKQGDTDAFLENLILAEQAINTETKVPVNATAKMYVYCKLIDHYSDMGNLETAKEYLDLMEVINEEAPNDLINQIQYNDAMANYHLASGNLNEALKHAEARLAHSKVLKLEEDIMNSHLMLSKIQEAKGDYKAGLESRDRYQAIKDSVFNRSNANSLAYYQTLYETEKQERQLAAQEASIQLLEKDKSAERKRAIFLVASIVAIFVMIILYRTRKNIEREKDQQEQFSQELLLSQEEERRRISKDLHDGLGQRLLLVKNRVHQSEDAETKELIDTTIEEVRSISRNLHPFQLQELGITKAIETTIDQVDENTHLFISAEIDNIDNLFDKKQEVNLYRIVQEALSNIVKHAKAEAGKVIIRKEANMVHMTIKDNGSGFDFNEKVHSVSSLGLKTLLERTRFLNGQMKIQSKASKGTTLEFQIPLA